MPHSIRFVTSGPSSKGRPIVVRTGSVIAWNVGQRPYWDAKMVASEPTCVALVHVLDDPDMGQYQSAVTAQQILEITRS